MVPSCPVPLYFRGLLCIIKGKHGFVVYCSNLRLNRNTCRKWTFLERAFHLRKKPRALIILQKEVFAT